MVPGGERSRGFDRGMCSIIDSSSGTINGRKVSRMCVWVGGWFCGRIEVGACVEVVFL